MTREVKGEVEYCKVFDTISEQFDKFRPRYSAESDYYSFESLSRPLEAEMVM